jgi:hypothetical protein
MPNKKTVKKSVSPVKSSAKKEIVAPFDTFPITYAKFGLIGAIAFMLFGLLLFILTLFFGVDISRLFI